MPRSAYDYSLDLLSARAYTIRNLRRKMVEKGYAGDDVDGAISRLVASGLLDDRKYAAEYARQKIAVGGASVRRVKQELTRKGIDVRTAEEAVAQTLESESVDQDAAIEKIALRQLRSMGDLDALAKRRRLFAFLARKGYELDDIKRAVGRLLQ